MEKFIVVALAVIFSLNIGLATGALAAVAHMHPAVCVMVGAGAFGSTLGLGLAVWQAVR